ncbi:hypothetical protein DYH10_01315 [Candidatus Saccharibacteria bacterium CPR2]|nr:hypothetical protein [Candidatus Saccharibacteria bacterium CPR2]
MNLLRYLGKNIFFVLAVITLTIYLPLFAIWTQLNNRETLKNWLEKSSLYENIVEDFFELTQSAPQNNESRESNKSSPLESSTDKGPLKREELLAILKQTYNEEFLRSGAHEILDGTYDWLEKKAEKPVYEVSLGEKAPELASKLGGELKLRLAKLPECSYAELIALEEKGFDPLQATCVPAGYDLNKQIDEYAAKYAQEDSFLYDATLSSNNLSMSKDVLEGLPSMFGLLNTLLFVLPLFLVIFTGLYVLTSTKRLESLERLGTRFFTTGLFAFLGFLILLSSRGWFKGADPNSGAEPGTKGPGFLQNIIGSIWNQAIGDIAKTGMILGVVIVLLGVGIWVGAWFVQNNKSGNIDNKKEEKVKT